MVLLYSDNKWTIMTYFVPRSYLYSEQSDAYFIYGTRGTHGTTRASRAARLRHTLWSIMRYIL